MTYKAIPGPMVITVDKKGGYSDATNSFASMINAEAQNGWIYHSMETITVSKKVGCALQPQYENTTVYMLIFYHE